MASCAFTTLDHGRAVKKAVRNEMAFRMRTLQIDSKFFAGKPYTPYIPLLAVEVMSDKEVTVASLKSSDDSTRRYTPCKSLDDDPFSKKPFGARIVKDTVSEYAIVRLEAVM